MIPSYVGERNRVHIYKPIRVVMVLSVAIYQEKGSNVGF